MSNLFSGNKAFLKNLFLDDVDKSFDQPDSFHKKFRNKRDPVERIKVRHQDYQDFNKTR